MYNSVCSMHKINFYFVLYTLYYKISYYNLKTFCFDIKNVAGLRCIDNIIDLKSVLFSSCYIVMSRFFFLSFLWSFFLYYHRHATVNPKLYSKLNLLNVYDFWNSMFTRKPVWWHVHRYLFNLTWPVHLFYNIVTEK